MKEGLSRLGNALPAAGSDLLGRLGRKKLNVTATRFAGDAFVYLSKRGKPGDPGPIVKVVLAELRKAEAAKTATDKSLVVIADSFGGEIVYDILTSAAREIEIQIDYPITVGWQVGLFGEMKLYLASSKDIPAHYPDGKVPKPANLKRWLNVFDVNDVLSYRVTPVFDGADDFLYDTGYSTLQAHGGYFLRAELLCTTRRPPELLNLRCCAVTTLFDQAPRGGAGTHVLAIGVGRYSHLIGGAGPLARKPLGLAQLTSPPVSAKAFVDWCLAPQLNPASVGFCNPTCPLASVEALISSDPPVSVTTPAGAVELAPATRSNIQNAFELWLPRVASNDGNIGIFYFCVHGITVTDQYLLAEDFSRSNAVPWENAFDISTTVRAVEREVKGALYFFIDACKAVSREVALTLGVSPLALQAVDLQKPVVRSSTSLMKQLGDGTRAFARKGKVSGFTEALVTAMSGYCGVREPGAPAWQIDGEVLASAVRKLLESENKTAKHRQVSEQTIRGSVPLLRLAAVPRVKVELDLLPEQTRALAILYLLSASGVNFEQEGARGIFKTEVPRGYYAVGARATGNEFAEILLPTKTWHHRCSL